MNKNTQQLGEEKISKLLLKYSIPAVIAMLVNAIYNIIDRIFIGQFVGEEALAALTIVFPFMMIIFAFAGLIGVGSAALISIYLGEKDENSANHVWGNMLSVMITGSLLVAIISYINRESLLTMFGADATIMPYAKSYLEIILIGIIFQMTSFGLTGVVRTEGKPILSMAAMLVAAITNIILDLVFIVGFGWGVQGAALATIIGQLLGLCILVPYFVRGKSVLKLHLKNLIPDGKLLIKIIGIGASSFITTVGASFAMLVLNKYLMQYGGNPALTAMGAINSLYTLFIMPVMGIQQGMQPIIGYNHGANQPERVRQTVVSGIGITVSFSTIVFVILQLFPEVFMGMFLSRESETMEVGVQGLRIFILMLPLLSINMIATGYFQSIAATGKSIFVGASRQFVFLVPAVLLLAPLFGLTGVWLATPVADLLSVLLAIIMLVPSLKSSENTDSNSEYQISKEGV